MSKFIVFEGPDGSGKTTQAKLIYQYLQEVLKGKVVLTKEPGGTKISDEIRRILLNPDHDSMEDLTEILLYAASRAQHVQEFIKPNLEEGNCVLCDRFIDSTIAYQGYGRGLDIDLIKQINQTATQGLTPHFSVYIMTTPEVSLQRITKRSDLDRLEQATADFHLRVHTGYQNLLNENNQNFAIDGNQNIETVHQNVKKLIKKHL